MNIDPRDLSLISNAFTDPQVRQASIERCEKGEPLAYILGEQAFWRYLFKVTPDVLIPRPDTERAVECALTHLPPNARFADLCTGSGCIAISICGERRDVSGVMVDLSSSALAIAEENARTIGVSDRLSAVNADILRGDPLGGERFDLIISNPPYIPSGDIADYPSLAYEPRMALDGGTDGMTFYRALVGRYAQNLKAGGVFVFEIGYDQREAITALAEEAGFDCTVTRDYGGYDRVALLKRN